jgi:hypothetical protein
MPSPVTKPAAAPLARLRDRMKSVSEPGVSAIAVTIGT